MASATSRRTTSQEEYGREASEAARVIAFAGILMVLLGIFHAIQGLVALVNDTFFVLRAEYVFEFNVTTWGWIHLAIGLLMVIAGPALFRGAAWARVVVLILACISILASFLWLPFQLVWSAIVVAFDVYVIWAVTVYARDIAD